MADASTESMKYSVAFKLWHTNISKHLSNTATIQPEHKLKFKKKQVTETN